MTASAKRKSRCFASIGEADIVPMLRQLLSLLFLFVAISVVIAYANTPTAEIAGRLVDIAGEQHAMDVAKWGRVPTYWFVKGHDLPLLGPWFVMGLVAALFARLGLWWWTKPGPDINKLVLHDEAGGTITMFGMEVNHDPGIHFVPFHIKKSKLRGATRFEHELFGVILACPGIPVDVLSNQEQSLADYVQASWMNIVETHGPGSLASMLVIAQHVGKTLSFSLTDKGWKLVRDKYVQLSIQVVRRVPSFYLLPMEVRDQLMMCLTILSTGLTPADVSEETLSILRDVRIADMRTAGAGNAGDEAKARDGIDIRKIAMLVSPDLTNIFSEFNINQSISKSDVLAGFFMKKEGILLVPPRFMREAFSRLLPAEIASQLQLSMPTSGPHPSDTMLMQVLEATGELVTVYKQVQAKNGIYSVRSGQRKYAACWALSTQNVKPEIINGWGDWSYEIEILSQGDLHAA